MVPDFDENGLLPQGIHRCDAAEVVARFGSGSPEREVETDELVDFLAWAQRAGVERVIVNGSYVTSKPAPNDVDLVILPGVDYPRGELAFSEQELEWPFLQVYVAVDEADLEAWSLQDFGTDRNRRPKGVVELLL